MKESHQEILDIEIYVNHKIILRTNWKNIYLALSFQFYVEILASVCAAQQREIRMSERIQKLETVTSVCYFSSIIICGLLFPLLISKC